MAGFFSSMPGVPEAHSQRVLVEPILTNKKLVEGDIWYSVVADWLQQWKRHVNLVPLRKYYHNRMHPGPIETTKEFGHSIELVHEEAWKLFKSWFGVADGHNILRHVVYGFTAGCEIELNLNYFHVTTPTTRKEHILRFSKAEKVGHVEYRARQAFDIGTNQETRMWGKLIESDVTWKLINSRTVSIGKALEMDSDFIRPELCIEVRDESGGWNNPPTHAPQCDEVASGRLYEYSIFEDVTATWEMDIHDQIDVIGKGFVDKLHVTFGRFVGRAKEYVIERETRIKETEKSIADESERIQQHLAQIEERTKRLEAREAAHVATVKTFCEERELHTKEIEDFKQQLKQEYEEKNKQLEEKFEVLKEDREKFDKELVKMAEINSIQDSKIKLDIGGKYFTSSILTLTKDPESMLSVMFSGRHELKMEPDGSYFIDRDGTHFRYILNYLRDGGINAATLPQDEAVMMELIHEADYYQLNGLSKSLRIILDKINSNA